MSAGYAGGASVLFGTSGVTRHPARAHASRAGTHGEEVVVEAGHGDPPRCVALAVMVQAQLPLTIRPLCSVSVDEILRKRSSDAVSGSSLSTATSASLPLSIVPSWSSSKEK